MSDNKTTPPVFGAGKVLLCILIALILGAGVLAGLYFWGNGQDMPPSHRPAAAVSNASISLLSEEIATEEPGETGDAPDSEPTDPVKTYDYEYKEILYEEEGLLLATIQGKRYVGYITVVDDPSRVYLGTCGYFSDTGSGKRVDQIADANNALLAVNGGGFEDPGGVGMGGMPTGIVIENGVLRHGGTCHAVGLDADGVLHAGYYSAKEFTDMGMQWAVSYGPTLLIDGEIQTFTNTYKEPRTAVGQREDGSIVLLSIQGRQVSALGVTLEELSEILLDYGVVTASNLDGGASSNLYFKGEYINISNSSGNPRPQPTAILVAPAGE